MFEFLLNNMGTILLGAVLLAVIVLIIVRMRQDKKKGNLSCGCGCQNCPSSNLCHKK